MGIPLIQSRVFWLNFITTLLLVGALFLPGGDFVNLLSPLAAKLIALAIAVLNVILRVWVTDSPISSVT